jgi:hypothetical protein
VVWVVEQKTFGVLTDQLSVVGFQTYQLLWAVSMGE